MFGVFNYTGNSERMGMTVSNLWPTVRLQDIILREEQHYTICVHVRPIPWMLEGDGCHIRSLSFDACLHYWQPLRMRY